MPSKDKINSDDQLKVMSPETARNVVPESDANAFAELYLSELSQDNINVQAIEAIANGVTTRSQEYQLIDIMAQDSRIAAALETYAQDITQTNSAGQIFWVEVSPSVENATDLLNWCEDKLDLLQPDKDAYSWALNLVKYGDVYVRLIKKSDYAKATTPTRKRQSKNSLNESTEIIETETNKMNNTPLNEAIKVIIKDNDDRYLPMYETQRKPCELFDITQLGKTVTFMEVPRAKVEELSASVSGQTGINNFNTITYNIEYNKKNGTNTDINFYAPTDFIHASLVGADNRTFEEFKLTMDEEDDDTSSVKSGTYVIKRGTGILNNLFKIWRELNLLETSVMMARLTRSNTILKIQAEIGDMDQQRTRSVMLRIKQMFEQKRSLSVNGQMAEYINPGPIENRIYVPVRNGIGSISVETVGNVEYDPKQLTDLDWFNNALYAGLGIPKQYFNWTDDSTGFNGGTSLTIISSQYGRRIKRYQQVLCQMVTDMLNIYLLDEGLNLEWLNQFTIKMQAPTTQEELDKTKATSDSLRNITDMMNSLSSLIDKAASLEILKTLLTPIVADQTVIKILEEQVEKVKAQEEKEDEELPPEDNFDSTNENTASLTPAEELQPPLEEPNLNSSHSNSEDLNMGVAPAMEEETTESYNEAKDKDYLPSFEDLQIDGTITGE